MIRCDERQVIVLIDIFFFLTNKSKFKYNDIISNNNNTHNIAL